MGVKPNFHVQVSIEQTFHLRLRTIVNFAGQLVKLFPFKSPSSFMIVNLLRLMLPFASTMSFVDDVTLAVYVQRQRSTL